MRKKEARQIQLSDAPTRKGIYPFVAIVVLLSACILSFHLPGSFTQDSFFVLNEALSVNIGHFSEWFSPTYVLIWKAMIAVAAALHLSPFVQVSTMCTLQTVLIVGALVQLVHTQANITWGATAGIAAAVIASPAVFVYFGELWRDVLMAALLLVSICLLHSFGQKESPKACGAAIFVLFLAGLVRQNGFIAALPLFFWAGLLWYRAVKRKYTYAALAAVMLVCIFAIWWSVVNRLLASTSYGAGASSIMYYDLMGISTRTGELLLPQSLTVPGYSLETVRARYQDEYNDLTGVNLPENTQEMRLIYNAWREAVLSHPKAYLEHRWRVTLRFLGVSNPGHLPYFYGIPEALYPTYIRDPGYHLRFPSTLVRQWGKKWLAKVDYWAFRQWIYGGLTAGVLLLNRRSLGTPFWLGLSGGIYWLSCFFSVPSTDFRYAWWSVLSVTTALALMLAQRWPMYLDRIFALLFTPLPKGG